VRKLVLWSYMVGWPLAILASPLDQADPEKGEVLYQTYCAACHGNDGRGVIPGTTDFNHTLETLSRNWEQTFERVRDGFQSPGSPLAMPPRGGADLTDAQLWDILSYIKKAFGPKP